MSEIIPLPKPFKLCQMVGEMPNESDIVLGNGVQFTNSWVWFFVDGLGNYFSFDSIEVLKVFFSQFKLSFVWEDSILYNFDSRNNNPSVFHHSYSFLVVDRAVSSNVFGSKTLAQGYKFYGGGYVVLFMFKLPFCLMFSNLSDLDKYFTFPLEILKISSSLFDLSLNNIYLWGRNYFCDRGSSILTV